MSNAAAPLEVLIDELKRLPGIGDKSATRLAYQLMNLSAEQTEKLVQAIRGVHTKLNRCRQCQNYTEGDLCPICADPKRDHSIICVVETARDVQAIERTREYRGLYHVLYGLISPVKGVGPENLTIRELVNRMADGQVKEVIMGLPPQRGRRRHLHLSGPDHQASGGAHHPPGLRRAGGLPAGTGRPPDHFSCPGGRLEL